MNKIKKTIIALTILGNILFYSPITLYGYWSDTFFLLTTIAITFYLITKIEIKLFKVIIVRINYFNIFIICFNSLSLWHGILPVHKIPKGRLAEKDEYGYFIERGNLGISNGCYGIVQHHKAIPFFPLLEIRVNTDSCSPLDYNNIITGNY